MKKKLLFFIFFLGSFIANAQTEYAIVIKSKINPRSVWPPDDNEGVHYISVGANGCSIDLYGRVDKVPKYCFFYVTGDPTQLLFTENMGASQICGSIRKTIAYNKDTFSYWYFNGCLADSEIMAIHIPELQPGETNAKCNEEIITLKNGWNWRYQLDNGGWTDFPSQFQEKTSISFKIKDLPGYISQSQIHFQAGYQTQFTNIRTFNIIGCSPELNGQPVADKTKCKFESSGSVTLKFKTELKDGDKFLFNIFYSSPVSFIKSVFATKDQIINNTFIWSGLAEGSYFIKYQSQANTNANTLVGAAAITTDPFVVGSPDPLTFSITQLQPKCRDEQGAIQVAASGGTPPYYYMIDSETLLQKHALTANPIQLSEGNYKITVVDSNSCIEK